MKCLIDTNILYLLTHLNNNEYNLEKIEKFCKDNECFIDLYSIFELFNNASVPIKQLKSFVNFLKIKKIKFFAMAQCVQLSKIVLTSPTSLQKAG